VSAVALLIMPYFAVTKRRISKRIDSAALAGDATNSITCITMAGTVLVGLVLNTLFGLWWELHGWFGQSAAEPIPQLPLIFAHPAGEACRSIGRTVHIVARR
jgi:hypothetical protein